MRYTVQIAFVYFGDPEWTMSQIGLRSVLGIGLALVRVMAIGFSLSHRSLPDTPFM